MHVNTYKQIFKPDCIFGFSQSPTEALLQMASLKATTTYSHFGLVLPKEGLTEALLQMASLMATTTFVSCSP